MNTDALPDKIGYTAMEGERGGWPALLPRGRGGGSGERRGIELQSTQAISTMAQAIDSIHGGGAGVAERILWIDGVGGFLCCEKDEVILGQATAGTGPDLAIVGDLSRQAAAIRRVGGDYLLQPLQATRIGDAVIDRPQLLHDGVEVGLGGRVRLRFTCPNPLSATARLDLISLHRWRPHVDGVLLLADTCLIGSSPTSHVHCPMWGAELLLFRQAASWCFRATEVVEVDGRSLQGVFPMNSGMRIRGENFSMSVE